MNPTHKFWWVVPIKNRIKLKKEKEKKGIVISFVNVQHLLDKHSNRATIYYHIWWTDQILQGFQTQFLNS